MNPTLDLLDLDVSYAYTHAVRLLSLDRVTPFWPDLGLRIDDIEAVKTAARRCVRAEIAIEALDDEERDYERMIAVHIAAFLAEVERSQGTAAAAQIRAWIEERYFVLDRLPDWRTMWQVLVVWLSRRKEHRVARFGLPLDKITKLPPDRPSLGGDRGRAGAAHRRGGSAPAGRMATPRPTRRTAATTPT